MSNRQNLQLAEQRLHVLIVDDDRHVREVDALRLRRMGHDATICADPQKALALVDADPDAFDLLVTDQVMAGLTGLDLAERVRDRGYDVPVVIMSGFSADLTAENVRAAGVHKVLHKPFGDEEWTSVLQSIVDRRASRA
jgi:CheY-like chemotaxis protein